VKFKPVPLYTNAVLIFQWHLRRRRKGHTPSSSSSTGKPKQHQNKGVIFFDMAILFN
jgi:hypothetical protein